MGINFTIINIVLQFWILNMELNNQNTANLIIISSPSGGGKTSLVRELLSSLDKIKISISYTTRNKRVGEEDGKDYFFVSQQDFISMQQANAFLENAEVFGYQYGTSGQAIAANMQLGIDTILVIDWQGAKQLRSKIPNTISIFILPPSTLELKNRLYKRNLDTQEVMEHRMLQAQDDMLHYDEYDFLVVNDNFAQARQELITIILAQRLKTAIQKVKLAGTIQQLLE
jgi:guanylate kinase